MSCDVPIIVVPTIPASVWQPVMMSPPPSQPRRAARDDGKVVLYSSARGVREPVWELDLDTGKRSKPKVGLYARFKNWLAAPSRRRHNQRVVDLANSYSDGVADGAAMALTGKPLKR